MMKNLLWFLLSILFSTSCFANKFYFTVAAHGGLGKGGTVDEETTKTRDLYKVGADSTLGYVMGPIMFGANAEYNIWKQKTDPDEVGGTNISGRQLTLSPVIGIPLRFFMLQFKYPLSSTYTMDKKSASGESVEYSKPTKPIAVMLAYSLGKSYLGVEYTKIEYKTLSHGSTENSLDKDSRFTVNSLGLVYGYKF